MRPSGLRPDSQVRDACLAHSCGDGFDCGAERVEQLGHFARAPGLPALLHDEAGQGDDIRVEGRLVGHAGAGLLRCRRLVLRTRWHTAEMRPLIVSTDLSVTSPRRLSPLNAPRGRLKVLVTVPPREHLLAWSRPN